MVTKCLKKKFTIANSTEIFSWLTKGLWSRLSMRKLAKSLWCKLNLWGYLQKHYLIYEWKEKHLSIFMITQWNIEMKAFLITTVVDETIWWISPYSSLTYVESVSMEYILEMGLCYYEFFFFLFLEKIVYLIYMWHVNNTRISLS